MWVLTTLVPAVAMACWKPGSYIGNTEDPGKGVRQQSRRQELCAFTALNAPEEGGLFVKAKETELLVKSWLLVARFLIQTLAPLTS